MARSKLSFCMRVWAVVWLGAQWTGRVSATASVMIRRPTPAKFLGILCRCGVALVGEDKNAASMSSSRSRAESLPLHGSSRQKHS
ncbi:hypothetical protein CCHR01_01181 [Colletotrichum chrysophilum]|uniref:Secreted protein n=1 Tax=Colletotrichum chrysophilum TaxID=1836956 RepID=A0AAD9AX52_9PEZI|nr:hypothetical protein CCHR01_01181 [Colletotrichum chrysophilum]